MKQNATPVQGDHLISPRTGYNHHGLFIGDGRVIHYSGLSTGMNSGPVEETSLDKFRDGKSFHIKRHPNRKFGPAESIERARSKLGQTSYCVLANNCQHFVCWCIDGDHASFQVERGAAGGEVVIAGLSGTAAIIGVAEVGVVSGLSASGTMSGLAAVGGVIGGGAVAGLGIMAATPAALSSQFINHTILRDHECLEGDERNSRKVGRIACNVGAAASTVGSVAAIGTFGSVAGFSAAGITSGLAAVGSTTGAGAVLGALGVSGGAMIGGVVVTVAAPAIAAAGIGYGAYRLAKWIRSPSIDVGAGSQKVISANLTNSESLTDRNSSKPQSHRKLPFSTPERLP